jgi:hypothetical protein
MLQLQTDTIEKEKLSDIAFAAEEVLLSIPDKRKRELDLYRAMLLGNEYHHKVKIVFVTENHEVKQVETTIWYASDKFVLLKGGRTIPVQCICEVVL